MLGLNTKHRTVILTFFFWGIIISLYSNSISINSIPIMAQFPSNSVQRIFQDKDGYLWFGTLDGLCRYDAYRLLTFRSNLNNPNLLTNNEITCISEDENNNLWVGTKEGLNILNRETFRIVHLNDSTIRREHIRSILTASDGTIWVGVGNGIYRYNSNFEVIKRYTSGSATASLPSNGVNAITEDAEGNIWVLLWRGGLHKYNKADDSFIHYPTVGTTNNPFRIFQDNHHQYWICTWGDGIFRFDPSQKGQEMYKSQQIFNKERQQPEDTFFSIVQDDSQGYIWAMSFSGLYALEYVNDGSVKQADISHLFKETNNIFSEIIKDRSGNLWIGAFSEGAFTINFNKPEIQNYPLKAITEKIGVVPSITSIYEDKDGVMWLNQNRLGLVLYYPHQKDVKLFSDFPPLRNVSGFRNTGCIKGFAGTNNIWVGLENDPIIYVLNRKGDIITLEEEINLGLWQSNPGLPRMFFEDKKKNIWIVTTGGLFMRPYNKKSIVYVSSSFGALTGITEDKDGSIWISSENSGVYEVISGNDSDYTKFEIKNYTEKSDNLISDNIQSIFADDNNRIWIGTKEGNIVVYDKAQKTFTDYSKSCGMFGEGILDILVDNYNRVWISTNKRITEYNPNNGALRDYTISDGLLVNSFLKGSYFKSGSNKIYFGGNRGISSFTSSDKLSDSPKPSKVLITDVKIQNQSVLQGFSDSRFNAISQTLTISPNDRNIEIDFSSFNYTFPGKIQYAYKMEGVDDDWVYTGSNRQFATYNQLGKGSYTFYVKATDENRLWSSEVTKFKIEKLPAFYETWWAYLIYSILVLVCLYWALGIVQNRLKLRNELRIAQIEKEKSEELTQTKLRYFTNISHDFLTPLTIISCLIDDIETSSKKQLPQYGIMRSNVSRLKRLLQQVLDFRKVESGNMKLKITNGDIVTLIKEVCYSHFSPLIRKKKIDFMFTSESNLSQAYFDTDKIDKVVFNLLSNAFKYTPQNGIIKVNLEFSEKGDHKYLTIKISDSGVGIAPEDLNNVFTRFYYNSRTDASETNGIGLSLTKDLVELHHGTISAESELNVGTTFIVSIPIDRECFKDFELVEPSQILISDESFDLSPMEEWENIGSKNDKGNVNLLLVEDNEDLLHTMHKILSGRYNVLTASNGIEAIEILKTENIDIIISDVMMPEVDGLELCRTLKSNIETSHISIILLTAKNSVDDRIECYNAGADGYISKPFDLKVLEARINNFITSRKDKQQEFKSNVEINISTLEYPTLDEQFLNNAVEIIEKYLSETEFDINTFAEHLNMSKSSLYRKIKTMTGLSPIEFIRNIRLKHACQMLRDKSISISEVAYSVGFSDPKYFTSCFKNEFNITPSEYQKG